MERVDLAKSVYNVPTHEEFFGLDDNYLEDEEFEEKEDKDEKLKKILAIMLALLQEFYLLHQFDTEYYFSSEQFAEDIQAFNMELKDNLKVLLIEFINQKNIEYASEWNMPSDIIDIDFEIDEIIDSGIDSVTDTLYADLKDKSDFYKYVATSVGIFSPHSNFRRALKKLTNAVEFRTDYIGKLVERDYLEFVYGQEALFTWHCTGINTCAWCYEIEAMGAMPLSWFPIDHIRGRCWKEPLDPDNFSDEYLKVRY